MPRALWWYGGGGRFLMSEVPLYPHTHSPSSSLHAPPLIATPASYTMQLLISFRKSTHPQNRQLVVYYYYLEYEVDSFVGELNFYN